MVTTSRASDSDLQKPLVISVILNDGSRLVTGHKFVYRLDPRFTNIEPRNHLIVWVTAGLLCGLLHCKPSDVSIRNVGGVLISFFSILTVLLTRTWASRPRPRTQNLSSRTAQGQGQQHCILVSNLVVNTAYRRSVFKEGTYCVSHQNVSVCSAVVNNGLDSWLFLKSVCLASMAHQVGVLNEYNSLPTTKAINRVPQNCWNNLTFSYLWGLFTLFRGKLVARFIIKWTTNSRDQCECKI